MNGIDPKWVFWLGIVVTIETAIGQGAIKLTNVVPADAAPYIIGWSQLLGFIGTTIMTALSGFSSANKGVLIAPPAPPANLPSIKPVILLAVLLGSLFAFAGDAKAQAQKFRSPQQVFDDLKSAGDQTRAVITGKQDPTAAVACNSKMFVHLTPDNLEQTFKNCIAQANGQLIDDVQNALASAKSYQTTGDKDGIACLEPALNIVKAAAFTPAVAAKDAVPATATTPEIPAVAAVPAKEPGLVTLFQKYREFTLAGGLTACQNWINGPTQLTIAAGANAIATGATVATGVAILAPK
jgi:hypothetical protein